MQKLRIHKSDGENFKITEVTSLIKKLKSEGLLHEINNTCSIFILHQVWKDVTLLPDFLAKIRVIQKTYPTKSSYSYYKDSELLFRDFLFNLYGSISENEPEFFLKQHSITEFNLQFENFLLILFLEPDFDWLLSRKDSFKSILMATIIHQLIQKGAS